MPVHAPEAPKLIIVAAPLAPLPPCYDSVDGGARCECGCDAPTVRAIPSWL